MIPDQHGRGELVISRRLSRLADAALWTGIAGLVAIGLYGWRRGVGSGALVVIAVAVLGLLSLFLVRPASRIRMVLGLAATALAVLAGEALLSMLAPGPGDDAAGTTSRWARAARKAGVAFDERSRLEVVMDYRSAGRRAVPSFRPYLLTRKGLPPEFTAGDRALLPLGGISGTLTVACNETGEYLVYPADEHGFDNPPGLFDAGGIDLVAVGDSMVLGECVAPEAGFVARLRREWKRGPVVGLGVSGSGPLFELAAVREYVENLRPRQVLWVYYEGNDLRNLKKEMRSPLLTPYLDPGYRQDLMRRQEEIDRVVGSWLEREIEATRRQAEGVNPGRGLGGWMTDVVLLRTLRGQLGWVEDDEEPSTAEALSLLRQILALTESTVSQWDGQVTFVYLPAWHAFSGKGEDFQREAVLGVVEELRIPVIDLLPRFEKHHDPLSLFPFRILGHYTEEGYGLVAETILEALEPGR